MKKVWDSEECSYFEVEDEWFDCVHMDGAKEFELWGDKLKVIYDDGREVWYHDVHGTWGDPTVFE